MSELTGHHILLGVTGGIAAYKSPELVRRLRKAGAEVRVVITAAAMEFVRPLTFQAVSGLPVHHDLLDPAAEAAMGHIELARWADDIVIAPASADCMARLAHGLADDLLTTLCLATEAPITLAPAMNRVMWAHPATQANAAGLVARGVRLLGPGEGDQACGEIGAGRMWEPTAIVDALAGSGPTATLADQEVLITAGPTRESLDPVRYLSNRSSGRMGFAVAAAAVSRGARVTVIAGPCSQPTPKNVNRIDVETAKQMYTAVMERATTSDIFIATAAVADYQVADVAEQKLKKGNDDEALTLTLLPNPDILKAVASLVDNRPYVVGFAAETEHLNDYAQAKRQRKGADLIAANWVGRSGHGFDSECNALEIFWKGGQRSLPPADKPALAEALMELITEHYHGTH